MKRVIATSLAVIMLLLSVLGISDNQMVFAAEEDKVTIHFKTDWGGADIFYWNQQKKFNNPVRWTGNAMDAEGDGWYVYTFENTKRVDFMMNYHGKQTTHFTENEAGEYWYVGNTRYTHKPGQEEITPTPSPKPTNTPLPTEPPTKAPTQAPTSVPTQVPTSVPKATNTPVPTQGITQVPTETPTPTVGLEEVWKPIRTEGPTKAPEVTIRPSSDVITVYCKSNDDAVNVYYYNVNSGKNTPVAWPGIAMEKIADGWFSYTISGATSAKIVFTTKTTETDEFYLRAGDNWYINGSVYTDPNEVPNRPQVTPTATVQPTATNVPEATATSVPVATATVAPTDVPTVGPTEGPTVGPTEGPTGVPTPTATVAPTETPATQTPTPQATATAVPTVAENTPTPQPTKEPVKGKIIVHAQMKTIYYWGINGNESDEPVGWPGVSMTDEGNGWYTFTIENATSSKIIFSDAGNGQTANLERNEGEWWYKGGSWTDKDPNGPTPTPGPTNTPRPTNTPKPTRDPNHSPTPTPEFSEDFRDETIYFVMTTRFYDGDSTNNIHCDDDAKIKNGDDDPAWRGDFKGLIERLDYIKALGFTAIWITPVVENASAYDYHGYHGVNLQKVDPRLETEGATYQDLIDEAHKRGMKIVQDIVLNHTSNSGEENLFPIVDRTYTLDKGVTGNSVVTKPKDSAIGKLNEFITIASNGLFTDYNAAEASGHQDAGPRMYNARDQWMKSEDLLYRQKVSIGWEDFTVTTGQFAGDCMELNTENPTVYNYLTETYNGYINMGVDAFRIDTVKHISRLTMNEVFIPSFKAAAAANGNDNFFMYAEVASRVSEIFNHGVRQVSPPHYTWKSSKSYSWNHNSTDGKDNLELCKQEYDDHQGTENHPKSDNVFLKGNEYHEPDYSEYSGMSIIDYAMHFNFSSAGRAFGKAKEEDQYINDASYGVVYVDSHDYGPSMDGKQDQNGNDLWRFEGGEQAWAENMCLMFTFRGIPCIYYGSEIEFMKGAKIDNYGTPLAQTGRAYFGDHLEGEVTATDFGEFTASGEVAKTLNKPLAKHLQRLNKIRAAIPALRRGQYSLENVEGNMAFKRRYTNEDTDSFVCVTITDSATFKGLPGGTYIDAVTGDTQTVAEGGTLTISAPGKGNMRVYVLDTPQTPAPGKVGEAGPYLQ